MAPCGVMVMLTVFYVVGCTSTKTNSKRPTTFGKEFVFVFPTFTTDNVTTAGLKLYALVSNQESEENTVTCKLHTGTVICNETLSSENSTEILFNPLYLNRSNSVIRITATGDIALIVGIAWSGQEDSREVQDNQGDSFLVLPVDCLGFEYRATTDSNATLNTKRNEIIIFPVDESAQNTTIWYTACDGRATNVSVPYPTLFSLACSEDISGFLISSNQRIAVISVITSNPENGYDNFGFEMLLPVKYWGTRYLISSLVIDDGNANDHPPSNYKVVASSNYTKISINCLPDDVLNAGETKTYQWNGTFALYLNASAPISVFQIPTSGSTRWSYFIQIPSVDHYLSDIRYFSLVHIQPSSIYSGKVVNYVSVDQIGRNLTIDGQPLNKNGSNFQILTYNNFPQTPFLFSDIKFTGQSTRFNVAPSDSMYGLLQYGKQTGASIYGHVSGMAINFTIDDKKITFDPFCHVGQSSTLKTTTAALTNVTKIITDFETTTVTFTNVTKIITDLANTTIANATDVEKVLVILNDTLHQAGDTLTVDDISNVAQVLCHCSVVADLFDQDFYLYMDCYNQVLNQQLQRIREAEFLYGASQMYLTCVQNMASNLINSSLNYNNTNLAMALRNTDCSSIINPADIYMEMVQYANYTVVVNQQQKYSGVGFRVINPDITAFAILPYTAICSTTASNSLPRRNDFVVYRNQKLFGSLNTNSSITKDADNGNNCQIQKDPKASNTIAVKILTNDTSFNDLVQPVAYGFSVKNFKTSLHAATACAYWWVDWYSDGCALVEVQDDIYICQCSHLTDFSLIVESSTTDPALCDKTLEILGLVLTSLSAIGLFVTIVLTFTRNYSHLCSINLFRTWFSHTTNIKSVIGDTLMISLFLFYILFALLSDSETFNLSKDECIAAAAVMYTVLMSTLCFAAFAGLTFFKVYYIVFTHHCMSFVTSKLFIVIISIVLPSLLTIILRFSLDDFFYRKDNFCWITPTEVGFAVVIPTTVMIVGDIVLTGLLIKGFFFSGSRVMQTARGRRKIIIKKIFVLLTVQVILGLPWVLQYFTIGSPTVTAFHYLFTLTNGSQGIWLTVIYLYSFMKSIKRLKKQEKSTQITEVPNGNVQNGSVHSNRNSNRSNRNSKPSISTTAMNSSRHINGYNSRRRSSTKGSAK